MHSYQESDPTPPREFYIGENVEKEKETQQRLCSSSSLKVLIPPTWNTTLSEKANWTALDTYIVQLAELHRGTHRFMSIIQVVQQVKMCGCDQEGFDWLLHRLAPLSSISRTTVSTSTAYFDEMKRLNNLY
jgi:hypothetical protein